MRRFGSLNPKAVHRNLEGLIPSEARRFSHIGVLPGHDPNL